MQNQPIRFIDSHCHLHDDEFYPELKEEVYQQAIEAGVQMICVGTDIRSSRQAIDFATNRKGVFAIIGIHPHEAKLNSSDEIAQLIKDFGQSVYGIGEIGLDYFYQHSPRDDQIQRLNEQLQLAVDNSLPVSFHVREAFDDFWPILDNFPRVRGVLHSFTDSRRNYEFARQRGLYIGVNGIATFTKSAEQTELFRDISLDRILLETDAPFLTPKPFRGKMNTPANVELVARYLAELKAVSVEELASQTIKNAQELFSL